MAAPNAEKNAVQITPESHLPKLVYHKPNSLGVGTIQTDSLQRLKEDIDEIPMVKRHTIDVPSITIGSIFTAVTNMLCSWDASSKVFRVSFGAFVVSVLVFLGYFLLDKRKPERDPSVINERIRNAKKDIQLVCQQVAIASEQQEDQAASL